MASIESVHPPEFEPSGFSQISQFPETIQGYVVERRKVGYHPPCALILEVEKKLEQGDARMQKIEGNLEEMLDILHMGKAFFRWAGYFGKLLAWGAPVVATWIAWLGIKK